MLITIIADASFCHDTGAAGYGFWIASQRGKEGGGGQIAHPVNNNNTAEMMALVNGLHHAIKENYVQQSDTVLLQTDCMAAILAFEHKRNSITDDEIKVVEYLEQLKIAFKLDLKYRHVKGHTDGSQPRLYVNNICDQVAGKHMAKKRKRLKLQAIKKQLL